MVFTELVYYIKISFLFLVAQVLEFVKTCVLQLRCSSREEK